MLSIYKVYGHTYKVVFSNPSGKKIKQIDFIDLQLYTSFQCLC